MRRELFIILFLLFACKILTAQNPYIQKYTISEGLPSNTVYTVFQDSRKFIWFATDAGVARFDGTRFTYFRRQDGLSSNDIFDIKEDSFGRIWFFHINASLNFLSDNHIHNEKNIPFLDSLKGSYFCKKFYEDSDQNIYFYNNPQRVIYGLSPQNIVTRYQMPSILVKNDIMSVTNEAMNIQEMMKDEHGEFSFLTSAGLIKATSLSGIPKIVSNKYHYSEIITASNKIKYAKVREDGSNKFSLKRFNYDLNFNNIKPLPETGSEFNNSVLEDKDGNLWISTYDKGVFCFRNDSLVYHLNIKNALSLLQDHENNIWISSHKEGVYKINPLITRRRHFGSTFSPNHSISALCRKDSLGIWLTDGRILYALINNEISKLDFQRSENSFNQILKVGKNTLIVGETSKYPYALEGVSVDPARNKIICEKISRSPIKLKKIIYSPEKNEVSSFNQYTVYTMDPVNLFRVITEKTIEERIYSTYYSADNELILNARNRYLHKGGISSKCGEIPFLNDKVITSHLNLNNTDELFNIEGDSLYILHNKQIINLSKVLEQPTHLNIKHLYYQDSILYIASPRNVYICKNPLNALTGKTVHLLMIDMNFRSINDILLDNNKLYVASDDGLTEIPVEDIQGNIIMPPIPYILSVRVNDDEINLNKNQITFTGEQRINIEFSCINYSISPITYSYMLEGADNRWTISMSNNVIIQNLPSGEYKFKLRTKKATSEWSESIEFGIEVQATVLEHPLLYFAIGLLLIGIIFLLMLARKNIQLKKQGVEHQIILLEQKSLQAMMNPHFIFNSIGSIQNYLLRNKPDEAGIYLSQFARLIRQNLNAIETSMVNLEEEIDRLKNYMDLEKLRMEDKFDYIIEIDEEVESEDILIPSMIIQPFVENSIWHGIANLEKHGSISLSFLLQDEKSLQIIVEDTGVGLRKAEKYRTGDNQHLNFGLNITRKRLELLSRKYNIKAGFTVSEKSPGAPNPGTKVVVVVPLLFGKSDAK